MNPYVNLKDNYGILIFLRIGGSHLMAIELKTCEKNLANYLELVLTL